MILPWVATQPWICNAPGVLLHDTLFITDDKTSILLLNKIQNVNESPMPFLHNLLPPILIPVQKCEDYISQKLGGRYAPCHLLVIIHMETTLILKNSNYPFFIWPQVQFNAHKSRALRFPLHHALFVQHHQGEKDVVPVFDDVRSFVTIHVCYHQDGNPLS